MSYTIYLVDNVQIVKDSSLNGYTKQCHDVFYDFLLFLNLKLMKNLATYCNSSDDEDIEKIQDHKIIQ